MVRLKWERLRRGWSLQTLGFHAGIQGAEISKIERDILKPYPSQRTRLARALGLAPDELFQEVEDQQAARREARQRIVQVIADEQ